MANNELSAEQKCKCGHSYASHGGLTNPCMHRDPCAQAGLGAYDCDCDMYEPTTPQPSAEPAQDGAEKVSDGVPYIPADGDTIDRIIRDIAELPDRNSPEDWPEAMLVTGDEMEAFLKSYVCQQQSAPQEPGGEHPLPELPDYIAKHRYSFGKDAEGFSTGSLVQSDFGQWVSSVDVHKLHREFRAAEAEVSTLRAQVEELRIMLDIRTIEVKGCEDSLLARIVELEGKR
jgi:hypothetical protein